MKPIMYIPKRYGESKTVRCPFCEKQAIVHNKQKIPTCLQHKHEQLSEITCICGDHLELRDGKFGPFFTCRKCGSMNFRKGLEIMQMMQQKGENQEHEKKPTPKNGLPTIKIEKKEIVVTSDELDFLY